jgi:hypothetical protein
VDGRCRFFSYLRGLSSNSSAGELPISRGPSSRALSSALSAEVEGMIKMEYGLLESANILWKATTNVPKNISSSSIHINQDKEEQSSVQKEKVKSTNLKKPDGLVSQTRVSGFGRTETKLVEEDDCST